MTRSALSLTCPHCKGALRVRDSKVETPLSRIVYLQCQDVECGATYRGSLEITHGIVASANPLPGVDLRMATSKRPANDTHPLPDNDTEPVVADTG